MIFVGKNNSFLGTLAASASFVGTGEDVSDFGAVKVIARGTSGAPGTVYTGFSNDNVNWTETSHAVVDVSTMAPIFVKVSGVYFRVRYVNGAVSHSYFRIQSVYESGGGVVVGGGGGGGGGLNPVREVVTLTSTDITNKSFTLPVAPANVTDLEFFPVGGPKQRYGIDYTVNLTEVSWNGLGLDGILTAGDVIELYYYT